MRWLGGSRASDAAPNTLPGLLADLVDPDCAAPPAAIAVLSAALPHPDLIALLESVATTTRQQARQLRAAARQGQRAVSPPPGAETEPALLGKRLQPLPAASGPTCAGGLAGLGSEQLCGLQMPLTSAEQSRLRRHVGRDDVIAELKRAQQPAGAPPPGGPPLPPDSLS